ncbi:hypothetical protein N7532_011168 [Penicillium argentinense]|uniref:3'-5' exonuclease domain-containing protein n=1 Tax=Penicillium argentinense TaxID=1131581 RepID=A0A9W9JUN9_9EURO|nr:uncharacterized protein N7532_011168 [Penicillium argentinense]KAJ5082125.1 hypothetical protein N7532_011168 [Penicillium argentinense]
MLCACPQFVTAARSSQLLENGFVSSNWVDRTVGVIEKTLEILSTLLCREQTTMLAPHPYGHYCSSFSVARPCNRRFVFSLASDSQQAVNVVRNRYRIQYSTLHATSCLRSTRTHPRKARRIDGSRVIRPFSNTRCSRIKLEEDDEEDEPPPKTPVRPPARLIRPVQNRGPRKEPHVVSGDLRDLIAARKLEPSPPPLPKPLNPAELRAIDKKAKSVFAVGLRKLDDQFLRLKWARFEDNLARCAKINQELQAEYDGIIAALVSRLEDKVMRSQAAGERLEHEWCEIEFSALPGLTKAISRAVFDISKLRYEASFTLFQYSKSVSLSMRIWLNNEFLLPRRSARDKVDRLLNHTRMRSVLYKSLQDKDHDVKHGLVEIRDLLHHVGPTFKRFLRRFENLQKEHSYATHAHRSVWFAARKSLDPLKKAELWDFAKTPHPIAGKYNVSSLLFDDKKNRDLRRMLERHPLLVASRVRTLYMKKWKPNQPPRSPALDKHWRQLDIMAPFLLNLKEVFVISNETRYLRESLGDHLGPMWSRVGEHTKTEIGNKLHQLNIRIRMNYSSLLHELTIYRSIHWARLEIEDKLHRMSEPNDIQERGLFNVPAPLSQDLRNFEDWIQKFCALDAHGVKMQVAVDMARYPGMPFQPWPVLMEKYEAIQNRLALEKRTAAMNTFGSVAVPKRKGRKRATTPAARSAKAAQGLASSREAWASKPFTRKPADDPTPLTLKLVKSKAAVDSSPKPAPPPTPEYTKLNPREIETRRALDVHSKAMNYVPRKGRRRRLAGMLHSRPSKVPMLKLVLGVGAKKSGGHSNTDKVVKPNSTVESSGQSGPNTSDAEKHSGKLSTIKPLQYPSPFNTGSTRKFSIHSRAFSVSYPIGDINASSTPTGDLPLSNETHLQSEAKDATPQQFWSHNSQRAPNGQKPIVHYCRSLENTEEVAQLFLSSEVIGFDMEWKAQATASDTIQNNLSLIQIANEERIALFQIALFKPARTLDDLVAPSLKRILESEDVTKVGVSIKADATRLRKFLGIDTRSILELSHLYKLVKYGQQAPKLVNKRMVNLSEQMEEHFGMPLEKAEEVRCGDWSRPLNYRQVQYAATDPYSCICLFNAMEQKRLAMEPMPPRPAHAELSLPIILPEGKVVLADEKEAVVADPLDVDVNGHS